MTTPEATVFRCTLCDAAIGTAAPGETITGEDLTAFIEQHHARVHAAVPTQRLPD